MRAVDHQPVEVRGLEPGITQGLGRQVGDLLKVKHLGRGRILLRFVLCGANNGRMPFESHSASMPKRNAAAISRL
ncbi:hypothetical protein D3C84_900350 [compost metagenome]